MPEKPDPVRLAAAIDAVLKSILNEKPELADSIATIAEWIAGAARGETASAAPANVVKAPAAEPPADFQSSPVVVRTAPIPAPIPTVHDPRTLQRTAIVPLRIGDAHIHLPVSGSTAEIGHARQAARPTEPAPDVSDAFDAAPEPSLELIAARCRLKAASCEVMLRRAVMADDDPELPEVVAEIGAMVTQAKAMPWCFLWAPFRGQPLPPLEVVGTAGRAYANLASIAELTDRIHKRPDLRKHLQKALELLAEAQSALRAILARTWLTRDDQDQADAFYWLRRVTETERCFIERFLRLDDPADPEAHERLRADIDALRVRVDNAAKQSKDIAGALNKLKYHARKFAIGGDSDELGALRSAAALVEAAGIDPADKRVREALGPAVAAIVQTTDPEEFLGKAAGAAAHAATGGASPQPRAYSPSVDRVREMLAGSRVVVLGGEELAHQRDRLSEAFALGDLDWISLREHASSAPLEAAIANPSTRVVIALVKLAGHQHIDDARRWSRQHNRAFVMVPGGFSPEQVAAAVLEQASERIAK